MSSSSHPRRGTYLSTGARVVGSNVEELLARASAAAVEELSAGDTSSTLYALRCTAERVVRGRPTVERLLEALTEDVRRADEGVPRLIRDEEVRQPVSRFGGLRWDVAAEPGEAWTGELVWRRVHPVVAGAPITLHVVLEERPSFVRLTLRVSADEGRASVRGHVGAGQVLPAFLTPLRGEVPLTWMGAPAAPRTIPAGDMRGFVQGVLGHADREVPVAVLAPLEDGGYLLDPGDLAWDLLGRARLYVIGEHRQTFELSDLVGDSRMSCYWGALRCYFPGWSRHDDPYDHPLLVGERVTDPLLRAAWMGEMGLWMAGRVELPPSIREPHPPEPLCVVVEEDAPGPADAPRPAEPTAPSEAAEPPPSAAPADARREAERTWLRSSQSSSNGCGVSAP